MALYGTTDSDESKPKWLRTGTKYTPEDVYASASGWVVEAGSPATGNANPNAKPEVLVAIRGLAGRIGAADITTIEFVTTSFSYAAGGTLSVLVRFNEAVDVTGSPTVTVDNDQVGGGSAATLVCVYASGDGTNELQFDLAIGASDATIAETNTWTIGENSLALAGGTIVDTGTATNSTITHSAAIGTAAGSIVVAA